MDRRASVLGRFAFGLETHLVHVECHLAGGLPGTTIVGLAEGAVKEARDRVKSAIRNSGFAYPTSHITLNLAPGHLSKTGTGFDLPIAIAILAANGQIPKTALVNTEFVGELGLFGELRRANNLLASAIACHNVGHRLFLPQGNRVEVGLIRGGSFCAAANLLQAVEMLCKGTQGEEAPLSENEAKQTIDGNNFDDIIGQHQAKRALSLAAAGGHHMLMVGPPGTGKTLLAECLIHLLPDLTPAQILEVASIYSARGDNRALYQRPPLRRPHHSASSAAMSGGGSSPMPGEITLAHAGVLFLDELPHFKPSTLDLLREPIETGVIAIARARYRATFPSRFQLVAAMNPCPAGYSCKEHTCRCTPAQVLRYQGRISGPLLDRIDLHVLVPELDRALMLQTPTKNTAPTNAQSFSAVRDTVKHAQRLQQKRQGCLNAYITTTQLAQRIHQSALDPRFLARVTEHFDLSMRSYHKVWRVALTLADFERAGRQLKGDTQSGLAESQVKESHVMEALSFRAMQWGGERAGSHSHSV